MGRFGAVGLAGGDGVAAGQAVSVGCVWPDWLGLAAGLASFRAAQPGSAAASLLFVVRGAVAWGRWVVMGLGGDFAGGCAVRGEPGGGAPVLLRLVVARIAPDGGCPVGGVRFKGGKGQEREVGARGIGASGPPVGAGVGGAAGPWDWRNVRRWWVE